MIASDPTYGGVPTIDDGASTGLVAKKPLPGDPTQPSSPLTAMPMTGTGATAQQGGELSQPVSAIPTFPTTGLTTNTDPISTAPTIQAPATSPTPASGSSPYTAQEQTALTNSGGQPYADAVQSAGNAVAQQNAAAHTTAPGTQITDPYGTTGQGGVAGASSSNTYDAVLAGEAAAGIHPTDPNFQDEVNQYWAAQGDPTTTATIAINGDPNTTPEQQAALTAGMTPEQIAADRSSLTTAQAGSNAAIANGFIDPAITSQYFTPNGVPTSLLPPADAPAAPAGATPTPLTAAGGANDVGTPSTTGAPGAKVALPSAPPTAPGASSTAGPATPPVAGAQLSPATVQFLMSLFSGGSAAGNTDPTTADQAAADQVSAINPADDLRSTVITNADDPRTASYASKVDAAASQLPTDRTGLVNTDTQHLLSLFNPTSVSANPSDRLKALQAAVDQATSNLSNVDQFKLANDKFGTYANETDPAFQAALRSATQKAAATGGLGSGMLNTDYGNLTLARQRDLGNERDSLFQNALASSVQDALNKQQAMAGLEGQLTGVEQSDADRALSAKEAAASGGANLADASIADQRNNLSTLQNLEGSSRATNTEQNAALRGERTYQTSQASDAIDRAIQQYELQQQTQQQNFTNGLNLLGIGSQGNPASTDIAGGSSIGSLASGIGAGDQQAIQSLLNLFGRNAAGAGGSATPQGAAPAGTNGFSLADLANLFGGQQQTGAGATAGQGLDESAIQQLLASLPQTTAASLPVQTTGSN